MNCMKSLLLMWNKKWLHTNKFGFNNIIGHNDIKKILNNAIHSKKPIHILLVGPQASAKTMFLLNISRLFKESLFVVGSNTTKAGLLSRLFELRPKFLLVDEVEKMSYQDQIALLHLMETGIISETKANKTRQMQLTSWVFASANSCENITQALLSRFLILQIKEYTFEEFKEIVVITLKNENIEENTAVCIAEKLWNEFKSKNVRDAIKIGRLASNAEEVQEIINIMKLYCKSIP
jgi:Holliday junction DNA helicase RuvB